jgi:hypothetical protein
MSMQQTPVRHAPQLLDWSLQKTCDRATHATGPTHATAPVGIAAEHCAGLFGEDMPASIVGVMLVLGMGAAPASGAEGTSPIDVVEGVAASGATCCGASGMGGATGGGMTPFPFSGLASALPSVGGKKSSLRASGHPETKVVIATQMATRLPHDDLPARGIRSNQAHRTSTTMQAPAWPIHQRRSRRLHPSQIPAHRTSVRRSYHRRCTRWTCPPQEQSMKAQSVAECPPATSDQRSANVEFTRAAGS